MGTDLFISQRVVEMENKSVPFSVRPLFGPVVEMENKSVPFSVPVAFPSFQEKGTDSDGSPQKTTRTSTPKGDISSNLSSCHE
jgi:hypothetical protein